MQIVFLLGLLVCGNCYTTNKERLTKNNLELNRSAVTEHRKFGSSQRMHMMKSLFKNTSAKFEQALKDSKMYDVCTNLYETTRLDADGNRYEITTSSTTTTVHPNSWAGKTIHSMFPGAWNKGHNMAQWLFHREGFWRSIEAMYWLTAIGVAGYIIDLMTQVAIKDVEGSSSTYTPLYMECYVPLRDALSFFQETTLEDYEDPCTLPSVVDCEAEGLPLSPIRAFAKCVMDNMNAVVNYQRDATIKIITVEKTHGMLDQIATHMAIHSSSENIQAELAKDAEEDEMQEFDMVRKLCSVSSQYDQLAAIVEREFADLMAANG